MAGVVEIYSPEGLRVDGRLWNELRHFSCKINTHPGSADGSSYVEQGNTKVICNVSGPAEPRLRSRQLQEKAFTTVKITVAPFSTTERRKQGNSDRRIQELAVTIKRVFDEAILTHLQPRSEIDIDLYVLAQDGGLIQACVNATSLALIDAGIPMYEYVAACTAGAFDRETLLDLNNLEENSLPFLTLATFGASDKLCLLQLETKTQFERLESMMAVAISGSHQIREMMDREVRRHGRRRLEKIK
ncbi:ribosomal protein S5 domain 2-type protein [Dipodascopsis tothii]|uniref:ribosomal protein S5 domain 2-type protein n=1 Tax=Dipodascopsis tothii TaxID=44089 RepID=UPI0034CF1C0F